LDLSLRNLILLARKWWWLLLLAPLLAGVSAYYTVSRQTPMYAASAIVEINPPATAQTADTFTNYDDNLVATYRALITTTAVLKPFIDNNQLPYTEEKLRAMISTSPITDTRLMKVTVSSPDPAEAARLANGVASQFSAFAKERSAQLTSSYRQALDQQIAKTNTDIQTTQQMIDDLLAGPDANSEETKVQLDTLRGNLADLQSTYRELLVTANQMDLTTAGATTSV
jgi:capsular polysaccharide biosynthesis protein